jgi:urease accessory protein
MKISPAFTRGVFVSLFLLPCMASAHTGMGAEHGFSHGWAHPFGGWDHLLAMVAVGLWAVQLGGRGRWAIPLTFIGVMILGGRVGMSGLTFSFMEVGVLGSVLILGLLLAAAWRLPIWASVPLVGLFAFCHGYVHGAEMSGSVSVWGSVLGFVTATALLHGVGMGLGLIARQGSQPLILRGAGAVCAVCGLLLIFV